MNATVEEDRAESWYDPSTGRVLLRVPQCGCSQVLWIVPDVTALDLSVARGDTERNPEIRALREDLWDHSYDALERAGRAQDVAGRRLAAHWSRLTYAAARAEYDAGALDRDKGAA